MTISSTVRIAGPFIGTGTATVFPYAFKIFAASNLQVVRADSSTGLESTLILNTDYTVSLNTDQDSNPGGNVTLLAVLAVGFTMVITSDIANLQPTDLTNQGGFYPEVITDALDRATIQIQQMADELTRSIKIPISDGLSLDMELPTAAARANSFLAFDATGEPTVVTAGSSGAPTTITRQQFSGTGSQVAFTLASDPGALGNSCEVFIGGIYQQRDTYTIAGTTLTFTAAPVAGTDNIEVVNFLTSAIGTTDSSLVTFIPAGTGATMRTAQAKMRDAVSVKDFGAVGDGVTDDTAAIQAAINAFDSVFIPEGSYLINSQVILRSNSKVFGAGMQATKILAPNIPIVYPQGVFHASSASLATQLDGIELSDMEIDGYVSTLGFSEQCALVQFAGVNNCIVDRVQFTGFRGDGIMIDSTNRFAAVRSNTNVTIRDCVFDGVNYDNRNGISIITGDGIHIVNNKFRRVSRSNMPGPIDIEPNNVNEVVRNINIIGNIIESFGGNGAIQVYIGGAASPRVTPVYGINICGNYISNNLLANATGIYVILEGSAGLIVNTSLPNAVRIANNTFECTIAQALSPINATRVRNIVISGNTIINGTACILGNPAEIQTSLFDASFINNFLYKSGNANGSLLIGSVKNLCISNNTFDSPNQGNSLRAISLLGSGVTTTSSYVAITNNAFVKGTSQTSSVRVSSHTQDSSSNTYSGNRDIGGALTSQFNSLYGQGEEYEEGTWTPIYTASGSPYTTVTMSSNAQYTRIGNQVTVCALLRTTNVDAAGATGNLQISGLPFVVSGTDPIFSVLIGTAIDFTATNFPLSGLAIHTTAKIGLSKRSSVDGATANVSVAALTTGIATYKNQLTLTCTYFV